MKFKKLTTMVVAGMLALSITACGSGGGNGASGSETGGGSATGISYPGTQDPDMVTVDLRTEPPELNSLLTTDAASGNVLRMIMTGLTQLDENDTPQPALAENWEMSEDGKTYTFHLRKDGKWSNGEPVTAHDFVYAWQKISQQETASSYGFIVYENLVNGTEVYEGTKDPSELGVKALDDYTLEVQLVNPLPYALHLFSFASFYPLNQKAYEEIGAEKYGKEPNQIVTNGAYRLSEWVHDDHILFEKNEEYFAAESIEIPKVTFLMMKDANTRMNAFKAGQVDAINISGDQLEQARSSGLNLKSYVDNGNWYLQYNLKKTELSSAKIRQALGMAIDLQSLCENVLKDGSIPATGLVPSSINGADGQKFAEAAGNMVTYDAGQAKQLFEEGLQEIGMTAEQFKITLLVDDQTTGQKLGAYFQEQWKQALGIQVEISPMPFKSRLNNMDNGDFYMALAGWAPDYNDAMTYLDMFTSENGNNHGKYSSEEYDRLIAEAAQEPDPAQRQELLIQAQKLAVQEDAPVFPLYFSVCNYAVSDKLDGLVRTGFQEFSFVNGAKIVK